MTEAIPKSVWDEEQRIKQIDQMEQERKQVCFTVPFNDMRTLKFKAQSINVFFVTVNQMFRSSSQLPTTAIHCFVLWTVRSDLITAHSAVVGSWKEPLNIFIDGSEKHICQSSFEV